MAVHPTAIVDSGARLGNDVEVGPLAIVEDATVIGDRCEIRAHATIKRFTTLGSDNTVHEGAVLGGEPQDLGFTGAESRLVIGQRNRIREGVTIHRSAKPGGATRVGSDCFLMTCVHVAHDDHIGDQVIIGSNATLAGQVDLADGCFLSGMVGVHQFCRVGRLAMIGGISKVVQDCLPYVITDGNPARARGLNVVGLRRAGIKAPQFRTLKEAYRLLLRAGLPLEIALERMATLGDPMVDEMIAFARSSKRGFVRAARDGSDAG